MTGFLGAWGALPLGPFTARWRGTLWHATRTDHVDGRSQKLIATEAGGPGYISMNLYRLRGGSRLRPCEMPAELARDFVTGAQVVGDGPKAAT